jgi:hypothetical protein
MGLGRWVCDSSSDNDNDNDNNNYDYDYDNNNNDKYNHPDYDDINDSNYFAHNQHCAKHYRSIEVR